PKLSSILEKLRRHEGRYITSHSIMLAEIACAIAHRIGWSSAPVFLKLSLAAFLHDLNLKDDYLASFKTLKQAKEAGDFREEALQLFEIHPVKAADYARKFQGIPPEVDTILLQHHERPDGSGFPLGLQHQAIAPIACAFIVAHDLLHFFLEQIPTNSREAMIQAFLAENSTRYAQGTFREIRDALASGSAVTP
ncbi:MAG: HD-GYP domain-containing protein, partial [Bdellovibrionota bacterium]